MTNITLRVLGAALLSAGLFSVTAQAATIGQVDASITGLRYRLIDLDLEDGITPTLSVAGELSAVSYAGVSDSYYGEIYFYPDSSETIYAPVFGESGLLVLNNAVPGNAATLGSVISTSSRLDSEPWSATLSQTSSSYSYDNTRYDSEGVLRNAVVTETNTNVSGAQGLRTEAGGQSILTINGKALLVIEGTATMTSQFDRSTLIDIYDSVNIEPGYGYGYGYGQGRTSGTMNLLLGTEAVGGTLPGSSFYETVSGSSFNLMAVTEFNDSSSYTYNAPFSDEIAGATGDTQNFQLTFAHLGDDPVDVGFAIFVDSTVTQQFQGYSSQTVVELGDPVEVVTPPVVVVPSIPEPGTYALMGLGLIGMAAAVRRARRTAPGV